MMGRADATSDRRALYPQITQISGLFSTPTGLGSGRCIRPGLGTTLLEEYGATGLQNQWARGSPLGFKKFREVQKIQGSKSKNPGNFTVRERVRYFIHENDHPSEVRSLAGSGSIANHPLLRRH